LAIAANAIKDHRVALKRETMLGRDLVLPLLDLRVRELDHRAAMRTNQVIVMVTIIQLKYGLNAIKLAATENASLLELCEHAINRGQTDVDLIGQKNPIDIFGTEVSLLGASKNIENF